MRKLLFAVILIFSAVIVQAQDKIHMKSGKVIEGKVTEVGVDEIKYKVDPAPDAAVFSVKKIDVAKIEFDGGHVEKFAEEIDDPESYSGQNKRMIKMDFLTPLRGFTTIGYEQSIRPGMSWEVGVGLIGLGRDLHNEMPRGAHIKGGLRFLKTPDFKSGNIRYWHLLKGAYVKPEVILGAYGRDYRFTVYDPNVYPFDYKEYSGRQTVTYGALNLVVGKQNVYADVFALDLYAGVGYGFVSTSKIEKMPNSFESHYSGLGGNRYGTVLWENDFPLSFVGGIKFGYLFK